MVEVTFIFITISSNVTGITEFSDCTSIFLFKDKNIYKTISEIVNKCSNFNDKAKEIINKTPFKIKKILATFGLSYIVIIEKNKKDNKFISLFFRIKKSKKYEDKNWIEIPISSFMTMDDIIDKNTILNFLDLYRKGKYFEILD